MSLCPEVTTDVPEYFVRYNFRPMKSHGLKTDTTYTFIIEDNCEGTQRALHPSLQPKGRWLSVPSGIEDCQSSQLHRRETLLQTQT